MNSEELRLRRRMETSDLPKLSQRFVTGQGILQVAWKVYIERMTWLTTKFSLEKLSSKFDETNPLVSLFTWTVMVPVGGTFCCND
jgi:hypothetical protein